MPLDDVEVINIRPIKIKEVEINTKQVILDE